MFIETRGAGECQLVEEEVGHNQVVVVALVGMVALVEDNHVELLDFHQAVHQDVVQLLLSKNHHVECLQLVPPGFVLLGPRKLTTSMLLVLATELANFQLTVLVNSLSLLVNQVGSWDQESHFELALRRSLSILRLLLQLLLTHQLDAVVLSLGRIVETIESQNEHDSHQGLSTTSRHEHD